MYLVVSVCLSICPCVYPSALSRLNHLTYDLYCQTKVFVCTVCKSAYAEVLCATESSTYLIHFWELPNVNLSAIAF